MSDLMFFIIKFYLFLFLVLKKWDNDYNLMKVIIDMVFEISIGFLLIVIIIIEVLIIGLIKLIIINFEEKYLFFNLIGIFL